MKVLWVGPYFSDRALAEKAAANQAAAKWSRGLLRGLDELGVEIRVLSHCPEQRWPAGGIIWQDNDKDWFLDWYPSMRIPYCNVVGIKGLWLDWAYLLRVRRLFKEWRPDVVLCYNSLHAENVSVMREATKVGIAAVPIILDGDDPRRDKWERLLKDNRYAAGVILLSHWMYVHYPRRDIPLMHMDGGASSFIGERPSHWVGKRHLFKLVHTGALDYWRGLEFMKKVVRLCRRSDVRFIFCGKCDKSKMWEEFGCDPRVDVKGFLPASEVDAICRSADVFLNVRDPSVGDNILNYPSKIPNYLTWGRPIISTWIESLSPEYRRVLVVDEGNDPASFVLKIDEVLSWSEKENVSMYETIRGWFVKNKTWGVQAGRTLAFLRNVSKSQ